MADGVSGRKVAVNRKKQATSRVKHLKSSDISVYKSSEAFVPFKENEESSHQKSSEEYFDLVCDPCRTVGENFEAEGFCTDCEEYLCGTCFKSHSRGKATRNHKILDKYNMPQRFAKTCDACESADEKIDAIGYCKTCEEYLCNYCYKSHSRSKATRDHILQDKDDMPEKSCISVTTSLSKLSIGMKDDSSCSKFSFIRDINVSSSTDKKICYIIDMSLVSDEVLIVADYDNKSLKKCNIAQNVVKDTLHFESTPFRLSRISNDQVALLTCDNMLETVSIHTIQIITVTAKLSVESTIELDGVCLDIEYIDGLFYTLFEDPTRILILKKSGEVNKSINLCPEAVVHCNNASRIAVSQYNNLIYVSASTAKAVVGINFDGQLIHKYKFAMTMLDGIAISPFGSVYVCDRQEFVVYKMKPDLSEALKLLEHNDGLCYPQAICYSAENQLLYISNGSDEAGDNNFIRVFRCH